MLYTIAFNIHIFVSTFTLLAGIITVSMSVNGWVKHKEYSRIDTGASVAFQIALYFQLVLGFVIYFTLRTTLEGALFEIPDSANDASLRFWAIEHIALMLFALSLTQIGRVFISKSGNSLKKYKASVFYHGTSLFLILFSVSMALFFR